jgi:hypothetical protein
VVFHAPILEQENGKLVYQYKSPFYHLPIANGQIANWQPKIFISMKNSNLALIRIGPWATLLPHHKRYIKRWP